MPLSKCTLIVISYGDEARSALLASLQDHDVAAVACATFLEAENLAVSDNCNGFLIDLTSIVKAKGEEKIIACTLMNFFPTLRVRTVGSMLVPMTMPGEARQDSSLGDFLNKSCAAFTPRKLRSFRRHNVCLSTVIHQGETDIRGFTLNVSWGGAFIVDTHSEGLIVGDEIVINIPELQIDVPAVICWIQPWGSRRPPGFGVSFRLDDETCTRFPACVLKQPRENDRDRLPAR